jgi:hypothetical protein
MAIAANDIIRATAGMLWNTASDIQNVFHWRVSDLGTADQSELIDILQAAVENVFTEITDVMANNITMGAINLFNVTKNEPYGSEAWPTLTGGAANGHALPPNSTVHAFGRTSVNQVRGDKHWPMVDEVNQIDGLLEADAIDDYTAASTAWVSDFTDVGTGASLESGVVRSKTGFEGQLAPFLAAVTQTVLHSLRNRRPGVGS